MNNEIQIFNNEDFGKVTAIVKEGEPWFVAKNVAKILGYDQTSNMLKRLDSNEKEKFDPSVMDGSNIQLSSMVRHITLINESGLYTAILGSKLPAAKKFKRWVTSEVLPAIRKTGEYKINKSRSFKLPETYVEALRQLADEVEAKEKALVVIEKQKPKVDFFDQVANSESTFDIGTAAKVLNLGIGRTGLFQFLRDEKILQSDNKPYQNMIDAGYFRVVEHSFKKPSGEICVRPKTVVFQKGLDYIRKKYIKYEKDFVNN